jgi:Fe-S cluster biogenesis protein NfuA
MNKNIELEKKVIEAINQIKPYLEADGGSIQFIELTENNVVNIKLTGACASCPMSAITLKDGVETAIKQALPEIKSVEAINF